MLQNDSHPKIVFISDTHGLYEKVAVPDGDILIHAGDFGRHGTLSELPAFHQWFVSHPHKHKVYVAGNHDWCFEQQNEVARKVMTDVVYLQDEAATVMGLKFYGSPWQPRFLDWAFNVNRGRLLAEIWAKIPDDIGVLVTHSAPYGILDETERGEKVGCQDLLARIKVIQPRFHLFGHIHEGYGVYRNESTVFVNGSVLDQNYNLVNQPVVLSSL